MTKIGQIASPMEPLKNDISGHSGPQDGGYTGGQCAGYGGVSGGDNGSYTQFAEQSANESASKIQTPMDGSSTIGAQGSSPSPQKGSSGIATPMTTPWGQN